MEEIASDPTFLPILEGFGNEVLIALPLLGLFIFSYFYFFVFNQLALPVVDGADPAVDAQNLTPDQLREQFLADRRTNMRPHYTDRQCPICLADARLAVETNCGHLFCGGCISTYWTTQHTTRLSPMLCPCCRQSVSVLFPQFTNDEISGIVHREGTPNGDGDDDGADGATPETVTELINTYNRRFSGLPRPWMDYVYDLPVLLRHLSSELFTFGGLAFVFRLRVFFLVLCTLLYVLMPFDIIPEGIVGIFGILDDALFVFILVIYLSILYRRVLATRGDRPRAD